MKEIWKDIPGYEGFYQASTLGNIRSLNRNVLSKYASIKNKNGRKETIFKRGRVLIPNLNRYGYFLCKLCINGKCKTLYIHSLIATTFLNKRPTEMNQINHINGIKKDNRIENLEWSNPKLNNQHARASGLWVETRNKPLICLETKKIYQSSSEAATDIGGYRSLINAVCRGERNHHKGLTFKYLEKK